MDRDKGMKIQVYCPEQQAFITPLEIGICPYYQAEPLDFRSTDGVVQQLFRCHVQCGCQIQYRYYEGGKLVTKQLDVVGDESRLRSIVEALMGQRAQAAGAAEATRPPAAGPILLVDDDADFVEINSAVLENAGYTVEKAYSGKECLERISQVNPSLVILDVMMEHFDSGFNVGRIIKEQHPGLPIILMTAIGEETGLDFKPRNDDDRRLLHADAYLDKGASPDELFTKIEELTG